MIRFVLCGLVCSLVLIGAPSAQQSEGKSGPRPVSPELTAAPRPGLPSSDEELWLVPPPDARPPARALTSFAAGVRNFNEGRFAEALPLFTAKALQGTPLQHYARYYAGLAHLNLSRPAEARAAFAQVRTAKPSGYLSQAATLREAEAAVAASDFAAAAKLYEDVARQPNGAPDAVLLALAQAHEKAGNGDKAREMYARLYYEFPLSDLAPLAEPALGPKNAEWLREVPNRYNLELGRAERLFASRRYQPARDAFDLLRTLAAGDEAELVTMRLAECDHYLGRYDRAREALAPFLDNASRKAEARFFYLTATRGLNRHDEYVALARQLVKDFPDSSWAEETLNNLGTHYILIDEDDKAAAVFAELYKAFPQGRHAPRAAWKAGWWAYKERQFTEAARLFESASAGHPRTDYRPSFLYWAARARERSGDRPGATSVYRIVHADYEQSYYGRLTGKRLETLGVLRADAKSSASGTAKTRAVAPAREDVTGDPASTPGGGAAGVGDSAATRGSERPANADLIRLLVALELYDAAREEILFAQRTSGDSPLLNATLAWTYHKQNDLRRGIIYMKRAYPQFLSAQGAALPTELLRVIFPMDYWPLISRYSKQHGLDPFLVAALINQESAFIPNARSSAGAIGLMQIMPPTGRRLARQQRLRFTNARLTQPEYNIRLGTAYFADLSRRLGGVHLALASYNAGASRVVTWTAERPGLDREEFIDDIPFPETQSYLKKILGTAEDYRSLYADLVTSKPAAATRKAAATTKKPPASAKKPGTTKKPAASAKKPTTRKPPKPPR